MVLPNTNIKGGVAVTYRSNSENFGAIGTFTSYEELNSILHKVVIEPFKTIADLLHGFNSYKLTEQVYKDYPEFENRVVSPQKRTYMLTNIFDRLNEIFFDTMPNDGKEYIQIYGRQNNNRVLKRVRKDYVQEHPNLNLYKVILPGFNGSGAIGEVLSNSPHWKTSDWT